MMMYIRFFVLFLFWVSYVGSGKSQSLLVKSIVMRFDDAAATPPVLDHNGDTCALIIIKTNNIEGLSFTNKSQYIKTSYTNGVYCVYMPTITKKLNYQHENYLPGQIDFGEYGYRSLKAGKVYVVQLADSSNETNEGLFIIKVEPAGAHVTFNDSIYDTSSLGILEFSVKGGKYNYTIKKHGYVPVDSQVVVAGGEIVSHYIKMKPVMRDVEITCNVKSAQIFIDGISYGKVGKLSVPIGLHRIRIQKDGYLDEDDLIDFSSSDSLLTYTLKENKKYIEVYPTSVCIHTEPSCSKVYKNNKRLKGWRKSGDIVLIMPGKYILSDNKGNRCKILVSSSPLEVHLSDNQSRTKKKEKREKSRLYRYYEEVIKNK